MGTKMIIHTVSDGETLKIIAEKYGTSEERLREHNEIEGESLSVGEQLLVLIPTRTYYPKPRDSAESVMARFGVCEREFYGNNPGVRDSRLPKDLAIRYTPHPYGAAATNGYFYKGTSPERFADTLLHLTYVTFASSALCDSGIKELFDTSEEIKIAKRAGVVPIVKIFDKRSDRSVKKINIDSIVDHAKKGGYGGISLDLAYTGNEPSEIAEFLVELRRAMIGNDLILIGEMSGGSEELCDYCDGCVLPICEGENLGEFTSRVKEYAERSESIKTFVEMPVFGKAGEAFIPIKEARDRARRGKYRLDSDKSSGFLSYDHKRVGKISFPSLEYIKAALATVNEYGFMGISFDINGFPGQFLNIYYSLFKTLKSITRTYSELYNRGS